MSHVSRGLRPIVLLVLILPLFASPIPAPAQAAFADPAFQSVWERTDKLVAQGQANRSWYWGPAPGVTVLEPDQDAPGGMRRVQYFDKTRMEINDPAADKSSPFYVTNGLLTVELMTGRMQVGNTAFQQRCPAALPLASDPDDAAAPTYAAFGRLMQAPKSDRTGQLVTAVTDGAGNVSTDAGKGAVDSVDLVYYEPATGRNIPRVFWQFLHSSGALIVGGQVTTGPLNQPWYVASGLPVTEAYWARVKIAGAPHDVLIQAYERRVLTYIPDYNGSPFAVQMGNVGQHYYDWRYRGAGCAAGGGNGGGSGPAPADLPRYAVDDATGVSGPAVSTMSAGSIQLARLGINWARVEPTPANPPAYIWSATDQSLAALAAAGIHVIGVITNCPAWACTDSAGPIDKADPARYAAFAAAVAARYSVAPYNMHIWEIFNEPDTTNPPNHQGSWGMHGDQYAALLKLTTPRVRAADPLAQVLLGGLGDEWFMDEQPPGPFNRNFLRDVIAAGGGPYFDYLNFHYYPQNPHFPSIADKAAALLAEAHAAGVDKPIVCTEVGLTSSPDPRWQAPGWPANSEAVQSRFLARAFVEGFAGGIRTITWFTLRDWQHAGPGLAIFAETGLAHYDWTPKPVLQAYHTLIQEVGARPFARRLDATALGRAGLTGYAFGSGNDQVWAVWSSSDASLPARPAGTIRRAVDLYGTALAAPGGSVQVGPDAVYLEISGP